MPIEFYKKKTLPTIYAVYGGKRYPIQGWEEFIALGGKEENIQIKSDEEIGRLGSGTYITPTNVAHYQSLFGITAPRAMPTPTTAPTPTEVSERDLAQWRAEEPKETVGPKWQEWREGMPTAPSAGEPPPAGQIPSELQEVLDILRSQLDELQKKGQVVNPVIEITPEKAVDFMAQAGREIDPYYSTQLKLAKDAFMKSLGYSREEIIAQETELEREYGKGVRQIGEQMAEAGFALSGKRRLSEQELAQAVQADIASRRRQLGFQAGEVARTFASEWGKTGLGTAPTLPAAPQALIGQGIFAREARELPFYELSPEVYEGLVGSKQYEQETQKRIRAAELESAWRQQEEARLRKLQL